MVTVVENYKVVYVCSYLSFPCFVFSLACISFHEFRFHDHDDTYSRSLIFRRNELIVSRSQVLF